MKKKLKTVIFILFIIACSNNLFSQGVKISTGGGSPHESAILEIESTTQGLLIPRMTSIQRGLISNPQPGLLVFDTDQNAFFIYGGLKWVDLSLSSEIWSQSVTDVFLTNTNQNVGIGTNAPSGKFVIKADGSKAPDDALFEIQDASGAPVFIVTSEGARLYVKDFTSTKGVSGGFAIGRYGAAKGLPDTTYLLVTPDSTRVFSRQSGVSGGFAVGRYGAAKGPTTTIFSTNPDSTRIYTNTDLKGVSGGFAVGRYGAAKAPADNYMHISKENYFIGHSSGQGITTGQYNLFLGYQSGFNDRTGERNTFLGHNSGYNNRWGDNNIYIGDSVGYSTVYAHDNIFIGNSSGFNTEADDPLYGSQNVFIGNFSGYKNLEGFYNVYVGQSAGHDNLNGFGNVFLGGRTGEVNLRSNNTFVGGASFYKNTTGFSNVSLGAYAGNNNLTGSANVFLGYQAGYNETGSNRLYIENSNSSSPLIYGQFDNDLVKINGTLGVNAVPNSRFHVNSIAGEDGMRVQIAGNTRFFVGDNGGVTIGTFYETPPARGLYVYGSVGIGDTDPTYKLELPNSTTNSVGRGRANAWHTYSDSRIKKDQKDIHYGLDEIMQLSPKHYMQFTSEFENGKLVLKDESEPTIGLIAQDVYEIIPEVVSKPDNENSDLWSLDYEKLVPVLIKAIQEQQAEIDKLNKKISDLNQR